ncbi:MAG: HAMP domain-containing histidine kinase [Phaeodactylibacter sp.]|nr:HAMP domain-containing histidine kinase [Phaeodactylibacter sp.]
MHHRLAFPLMLASILLLCGFQAFWLHQSWQEQYELLHKEASRLFARSVIEVQDSILQDWVETQMPERPDSVHASLLHHQSNIIEHRIEGPAPESTDSVQVAVFQYQENIIGHRGKEKGRTRIITGGPAKEKAIRMGDTQLRLEIDGPEGDDWAPGLLQSVILKVQSRDSSGLLPFEKVDSSLLAGRIAAAFRDSLEKNGSPLPFSIVNPEQDGREEQAAIVTATASSILPSSPGYQARLSDYRPYLLRKIGPQILFSLLLVSLTVGAFALIYRNLRRQQQLAEMRSGLISNITHELKTPIATVSVAMEALENFNALNDPARTREYLDISRSELNRLSMLVDKVLKTAAFEQQGLELQPETLDLRQLAEETLSYLKVHFEKTGAEVQFTCRGTDFTIEADRTHLANVLYNLIDNALKYSPEKPRITIALQNGQDNIQLSVQDAGLGIPPEYQSRIFDKFFRVPQGDEHDIKGYGLGLSYVAKVVEKHKGKIKVESKPGEGSRFIVFLPKMYTPGK